MKTKSRNYVVKWKRFDYADPCGRNEYSTESDDRPSLRDAIERALYAEAHGSKGVVVQIETVEELDRAEWGAPPPTDHAVAAERARILAIIESQPYAPDTVVGKRQQWVKDEIARKVREGK